MLQTVSYRRSDQSIPVCLYVRYNLCDLEHLQLKITVVLQYPKNIYTYSTVTRQGRCIV